MLFSRGFVGAGKALAAKDRALKILLERRTRGGIAKGVFCFSTKIQNEKLKKKKKEKQIKRMGLLKSNH